MYSGQQENDEQNGTGVMTWPDGQHYEVEWLKGQRQDYGILGMGVFIMAIGGRAVGVPLSLR